jgi:hypothetical protein
VFSILVIYGLGQIHDLLVFITVVVLLEGTAQSDTVQLLDVVVSQAEVIEIFKNEEQTNNSKNVKVFFILIIYKI